jgi:hypothetical protein
MSRYNHRCATPCSHFPLLLHHQLLPEDKESTMLFRLANVLVCLTAGSSVVSSQRSSDSLDLNRPYVQSLTSGMSRSCQKSYSIYSEALSVYQNIKAKGLVWIIRDPGDETFFGCIEDAIQ